MPINKTYKMVKFRNMFTENKNYATYNFITLDIALQRSDRWCVMVQILLSKCAP